MAKFPTICNGDDTETQLPHKWEICGSCEGHGKSSAYLGAFTRDDLDDAGEEFCEDYFAGRLDRPCEECGGSGKVAVADEGRMTKAQRKAWKDQCDDDADYHATVEAERRAEHFMDCRFAGADPWDN